MTTQRLGTLSGSAALVLLAISTSACNSVIGLNDLKVDDSPIAPAVECETNRECTSKLTAAAGAETMGVCVKPEGKCVALLSEDCDTITGDPQQDDLIVLGSLFSTKGAQAATNLNRQQSAMLAVTEINSLGGIPSPSGGARQLVMVSCNESDGAWKRAGVHLVDELKVPAIVGPNTSQDTIDVSTQISVPGGTVMMTPSAVASEIGDLSDNDLTWLMVPSDVQRAPLMIRQINELERRIKMERGVETVKLSVITRGDALGIGTRTSLNSLRLNDRPLSEQIGTDKTVLLDPYEPTIKEPNQALISKHVAFTPDIVVLAGTAEAISYVMKPLEEAWTAATRPQYVLIDSTKVPELLTLVTGNDELRRRVRGTGIVPGSESANVYETFKQAYLSAYPGSTATISGMGPSYDAAYSIAYAIAAAGDEAITGATVSQNLRKLAGGATTIEVGRQHMTRAFQQLSEGERIRAIGTFGALEWNENGTVVGGTLEMWCIAAPGGGTPAYRSSMLYFDLASSTESGSYVQCAP
jgi:ABC-type branched-subunit amino acid transport system substrate-binding protein